MSQIPAAHRNSLFDWLKGWAIAAVALDHLRVVPEPFVVWSVNIFVLVTAALYSEPGYFFSGRKLLLRTAQVLYSVAAAIVFFDLAFALLDAPLNRAVLSVMLNPYRFFVANPYLGNIWYIALHLQILILLFCCLRAGAFRYPKAVCGVSLAVSAVSFAATNFVMGRYHTILVSSWLVYLAAGYYGLVPLLRAVEERPHNRWKWLGASAGALVLFYLLYPLFPALFTNTYRASPLMLSFYFALVIFLAELFQLLSAFPASLAFRSAVALMGRHTLAIYLTHDAFSRLWGLLVASPAVLAVLCVCSGMVFGVITDRIFAALRSVPAQVQAVRAVLRNSREART